MSPRSFVSKLIICAFSKQITIWYSFITSALLNCSLKLCFLLQPLCALGHSLNSIFKQFFPFPHCSTHSILSICSQQRQLTQKCSSIQHQPPMCLICKALPLVIQPVCINMIHFLNFTYKLLPICYLSAQGEIKIHIKELVNSFKSGTAV